MCELQHGGEVWLFINLSRWSVSRRNLQTHNTVKIRRRGWGDDCTRCLLVLSACLIQLGPDLLCAQSALVQLKYETLSRLYVDNILEAHSL